MTAKLDALRDLLGKVEAGSGIEYAAYRKAFDGIDGRPAEMEYPILRDQARLAFQGSLDAAKALHEAVLPGWRYSITHGPSGDVVVVAERLGVDVYTLGAATDNPARAWLIAVLRALISQAEGDAA